MSDTVNIVLTGKIRSSFERAEVVASLAKMLKISDGEADAMLADRETVLKRDVPPAIAARHIQILRDVGAKVRAEASHAPLTPPQMEPLPPVTESNPAPVQPEDETPLANRRPTLELELVPIATPETDIDSDPMPYSGSGPVATHEPITPSYISSSLPTGTRMAATYTPPMFGIGLAGRIGRLRYLVYGCLGVFLVGLVGALLLMMTGFSAAKFSTSGAPGLLLGAVVLGLAILWMSIRVTVLRLHDVNLSGKWLLLSILPGFIAGITHSPALMTFATLLSWLVFLVLLVWPGSSSDNDYGDPPDPNTVPIYVGTAFVILFAVLGFKGYTQHVLPLTQQMAERHTATTPD